VSAIPPAYSQLRAAARLDLAAATPLPAPLAIYLEPTNICNFKCSYCPESFPDYSTISGGLSRLSLEDAARVLQQIRDLGPVKTLNLYMMGEPLANRHLPEIVALAVRLQAASRVIVTTNASLLDEAAARALLASGLHYLRVSVYGASPESHFRITNSRIPLARVAENVARLHALRAQLGLSSPFIYAKMIDPGDPAERELFLQTFRPISDEAALEPAMNWNDPPQGNLSGLAPDRLLATAPFAARKQVCPFPFYTLVIHSDLTVSTCCVDWAKQTAVGNLKTQSLQEVWNGPALRDFRLAHLRRQRETLPACRHCTYLHTAPDKLDALTPEAYLARL